MLFFISICFVRILLQIQIEYWLHYNTIQLNLQYTTIQYNKTQYNKTQWDTIQYTTSEYDPLQCNTVQ